VSGNVHEIDCHNGNIGFYRDFGGLSLETACYIGAEDMTEVYDSVDKGLYDVLYALYKSGERVRVWFGDAETGRAWNEEYGVTGRVSRSCGRVKVPLLVHNARSFGGAELSAHCIVRIDRIADRKTLWSAGNFHTDGYTVEGNADGTFSVRTDDGSVLCRMADRRRAERYIAFMRGERYSK
jgi:hypothetical protein